MYSLLAGVALSIAAPVPPPPSDVTPPPTGPAPTLVFLKADANGKVLVQVVREEKVDALPPGVPAQPVAGRAIIVRQARRSMTIELGEVKDLTITTVDGRKVSVEEATKRLEKGETVLIAPAGQPISPAYLKVFKDDTLILSSPELTGGTAIPKQNIPPKPIQIQPIQIQPALPRGVIPPQPGGVIEIQIGPGVEAIPLPAVPAVPAPQKILPAEKAIPAQKAIQPLLPAQPVEKGSPVPSKQDK